MIMIIICNRGSHLLRVIYNIMHFSGRSVVPLSTCSTFQWSANGHGPAPLPRPPAAAIQWQLYFSACDGCFETKFAKVQTIHSMINDSSGREEQHLASGQRKLAVGHNMSYSSSRDSPMRALCLSPQYNKKLEDWMWQKGGGRDVLFLIITRSLTQSPGSGVPNICAVRELQYSLQTQMQMWNFVI